MVALTSKDWCHSIITSWTMHHGAAIFAKKEDRVYRRNTERWLKFGVKALTLHFNKVQQTYTSTSFAIAGKQYLATTLFYYKPVVLNLFWPMNRLLKNIRWTILLFWYGMNNLSTLYCTQVSERFIKDLWNSTTTRNSGPPVIHLNHVENHCYTVSLHPIHANQLYASDVPGCTRTKKQCSEAFRFFARQPRTLRRVKSVDRWHRKNLASIVTKPSFMTWRSKQVSCDLSCWTAVHKLFWARPRWVW